MGVFTNAVTLFFVIISVLKRNNCAKLKNEIWKLIRVVVKDLMQGGPDLRIVELAMTSGRCALFERMYK